MEINGVKTVLKNGLWYLSVMLGCNYSNDATLSTCKLDQA